MFFVNLKYTLGENSKPPTQARRLVIGSKDVILAGIDLMPAHTASSSIDIDRAYVYVSSIMHTADDDKGPLWHGWALREAFLAGMQAVIEEECGCEPAGISEAADAMFKALKDGKTAFGKMAASAARQGYIAKNAGV